MGDGCVFLTQIGVHNKEVEVLLQVTAVFRNLSSKQVEYSSQQVVAKTEVITALIYKPRFKKGYSDVIFPHRSAEVRNKPERRVQARRWGKDRGRLAGRSER